MTAGMPAEAAKSLIVSGAKSNGLNLTSDAIDAASKALSTSTRHDPETAGYVPVDGDHRAFLVIDGRAVDLDLVDHVMALVRQHATPAASSPSAGATSQRHAGQTSRAQSAVEKVRQQEKSEALVYAQQLAIGPNPWAAESFNQTKQAIIRLNLPHVAAQLKAKVGR